MKRLHRFTEIILSDLGVWHKFSHEVVTAEHESKVKSDQTEIKLQKMVKKKSPI